VKRFVAALCVLSYGWPASAQSALPPRVLQLAELKRNIKTRLARLPNYTCLETIERSQRKNARQAFRYLDTVRVEVAAVKNREVYAWPGAKEFADRDITEIIGAGTIGGGSFADEIRSVFVNNTSTITWHGEEEQFGRRALRWDYTIPYNLSGWTVSTGKTSGRVSATGAFWVDAESLDLLRIETNAADIPPDLPFTAVKNTLDYARVRIASTDLLLPQSAELILTEVTGHESRNRIEFSHCREFGANTMLTFESPSTVTPTAPAVLVDEISLPPGLQLRVRLAHAIDSESAAVGDAVSAVVESRAEQKGSMVIPKGAVLRGRIRRFERDATPTDHYIVGLEFTDLEFSGYHARFFGDMESVETIPHLQRLLSTSRTKTLDFGISGGIMTRSETEVYRAIPIPGVSTFFMAAAKFRLPEGLHMIWRTVSVTK
jgi:hypothetical protein